MLRRSLLALVALVELGIAAPARADITFFNDPNYGSAVIEDGSIPPGCIPQYNFAFPLDKQSALAFQKHVDPLTSGQKVTCKSVLARNTPFGRCGIYSLGGCGKPF